jgi:hypothetical protein
MQREIMKPREAASFLASAGYDIGVSGLAHRRQKGQPPEYHRIGKRPVYPVHALRRFLDGN